jgi:hypothetical protein
MAKPPARHTRNHVRHQPYLGPEDSKRLIEYCAATNTTESGVVREALRRYWADAPTDATLIMGRLDRVQRAQTRTQRDLELLTEAFAVFVKFWFAHTPSVAEGSHKAARTMAEARYKQFVDYVSSQFAAGRRFLEDLPQDMVADESELAELAATKGLRPSVSGEESADESGRPSNEH